MLKKFFSDKIIYIKNLIASSYMTKKELKECLEHEVDIWSKKTYYELKKELQEVIAYEAEFKGLKYQVEVEILEINDEYIHVSIAADDYGWRAFFPIGHSFLVYKDGRVDK